MPNYLAFASDNYAGACPEAWQAMAEANSGFVSSYGDDPWTAQACSMIRDTFETDCQVFFVFNGTAANSLALASLCQSYHSVICHELAHIETDECGAPEFFSNGTKILPAPGADGKLDLAAVEHLITRRADIHYPKPRVLCLTQATELGTIYTPAEVATAGAFARQHGLRLQMDGARFANAVASLGCHPGDISWRAGVDVLCLGGAKNGMAVGEAVVFFKKDLAEEFDYRCKQAGQLASKMRFLAAPWTGMLRNNTWLTRATHANHCAQTLAEQLRAIPQVDLMFPVQANAVFISMPQTLIEALHGLGWHFYSFIGAGGARLMCSWATEESDIEALVSDIKRLAAG
ncbi:MAG: low specificity L-threonine aldolase [Geobacteraceae bacterium]|nr:low specificity L-threonine aldolase [Geobacteraceae bacterium]